MFCKTKRSGGYWQTYRQTESNHLPAIDDDGDLPHEKWGKYFSKRSRYAFHDPMMLPGNEKMIDSWLENELEEHPETFSAEKRKEKVSPSGKDKATQLIDNLCDEDKTNFFLRLIGLDPCSDKIKALQRVTN